MLSGNCILPRQRCKPTLVPVKDSSLACPAEHCGAPEVCPLNQVQAGTSVRIKHLSASPEVSHRLREMGFCEEQQVRVVSKETNVICQVCHARLGLSQQLAEVILVEPLPPSRELRVA
jgi:Fe2+ transport system protein FeoA